MQRRPARAALMPVVVETSAPGSRAPLGGARVESLVQLTLKAERVADAMISVTFLSTRAIARMNREQLGHAGPTDIITFELTRTHADAPVTGDMYICADVARENARAWGVPVREELARLVIHGTLHTLGREHPDGDERVGSPMWRAQEKYLRAAVRRGLV
ncbi:MAG TPA: rRNA maturation RNase YbeY [Gemmatimonadaceae bacterium]|nr:rRNA maturation RNase YbeY [Gemmatimonadaceae bacterium]